MSDVTPPAPLTPRSTLGVALNDSAGYCVDGVCHVPSALTPDVVATDGDACTPR